MAELLLAALEVTEFELDELLTELFAALLTALLITLLDELLAELLEELAELGVGEVLQIAPFTRGVSIGPLPFI